MTDKSKDPFFGLKFIAYCRTGLPLNAEDIDEEAFFSFAKWQICKVRNRLWLDPVWDLYSNEEIMVEYFSIKFDENNDLRKEFERGLQEFKQSDIDMLEAMERRYMQQLAAEQPEQGIINEGNAIPEPGPAVEFEDKF